MLIKDEIIIGIKNIPFSKTINTNEWIVLNIPRFVRHSYTLTGVVLLNRSWIEVNSSL
jgi:hypothetical protein